jgi:Gas vesicle synthesis protein GvpO
VADSQVSGRSDDKSPPGRERAGGHDEHDGRRSTRPRGDGRLTAAKAAQMGLEQIAEVTGKEADGVASVEPSDDGWVVGVEVVEDRRIPSSTDILAIYQAELDHSGELLSYRRVTRYKRGQGGSDYEGESW